MSDRCLPSGCIVRRATERDIGTIRRLVLSAYLDFTQLRWQQFWLIEQEKKNDCLWTVTQFYCCSRIR
ncbi:hypothetical protein H1P_4920001 [Hyella patelloides LEGE 07179]|uniref:Uncharacterized protein n=1 Tax=Hyella patelloides LEGE 07179 TaxID=945734 RepID=A0A563VZ75_9CYAN|nr:hypothetical protein H1P_4920001 [Hyella patelloides LEGE 07179]